MTLDTLVVTTSLQEPMYTLFVDYALRYRVHVIREE